jgi:thiol-disulfide isomerase/thioredoxin
MTKSILKHLAIFIGLVFAVSSLNGCGGPSANNANSNGNANTNTPNTNGYSSVAAEYPPLQSALADEEFEQMDGSKFTVSSKKGKVLLLNIWGIWCGPCRAEMPELVKMQDQYGAQGFEVVGINIGDEDGETENMDAIKKFVGQQKLNYTIARSTDPAATTKAFHAITQKSVVPQSLLVDREGRLRGVFSGYGGNVISSMKESVDKVVTQQ